MLTIFHTPPLPEMIDALQSNQRRINRSYVAVSQYTADQWSEYCPDIVRVVQNGIDLDGWTSEVSVKSTDSLAWVGRITPEKGTHLAIKAAIELNMPITVGGSVYDKQYFKSAIKPLLKHPLVTYAGHVNKNKVNEIYSHASVALITPQWDEPFGLVALEALISGTPVAAYARGGLSSIITSRVGALAHENSVKSLVAAVKQALKKDRKTCVQYTKLNYSIQAMTENYMRIAHEHVSIALSEDVAIQGARYI
jgi:glycosyltransferase involved in cell wall biosynthesis